MKVDPQMVQLAELLARRVGPNGGKCYWNDPEPGLWVCAFETPESEYGLILELALHGKAPTETPHQWQLSMYNLGRWRRHGWWHRGEHRPRPILDPLVNHPALDDLLCAIEVWQEEVGALIDELVEALEAA